MGFSYNNNDSVENVNILYVFNEGRDKRFNSKKSFPEDFFYFFNLLNKNYQNTDYIEMNPLNKSLLSRLIDLAEKFLRKFTDLPFYFSQLVTFKNLKKILKSKLIILTNETVGFSMLLILYILKLIKSELKSIIFIMGFFNNLVNKNHNSKLKNLLLLKFIDIFDTFIFLGKKEYEYANLKFPEYSKKFFYIPFSIDLKFWINENNNLQLKENILFIGNDKNRDFKTLNLIANSLPDKNFLFVTNNESLSLPKNVKLINGSWRKELISDNEIKNLYTTSWLSVIPLKESLQPSGQSVALQSMSMNVPVMISFTKGFWDEDLFEDEKNIYFIKNGVEEWVSKINNLEKSKNRNLIVKNAYQTVENNFDINKNFDLFNQLVEKILRK